MHFDDRLATVLRLRAQGERAAKTQFRQLIDLLGERPQAGDPALKAAAYLRLIALAEAIPVKERAAIVGENGWRFRNPELVRWFGEAHPTIAAAALYRAHLTGAEWEELIPRLPIRARGFLRHRRDLPPEAVSVLDRLGVQDRALPLPDMVEMLVEESAIPDAPEPLILTPANDIEGHAAMTDEAVPAAEEHAKPTEEPPSRRRATTDGEGIRALVERIEAFKRNRGTTLPGEAPSLPMAGLEAVAPRKPVDAFIFSTDSEGRIDWAEGEIAPMVVGIELAVRAERNENGDGFAAAFINRRPVRGAHLALHGAEAIAGDWIVDAAPRFTRNEGRFFGFVGRFRRAVTPAEDQRHAGADRLRQLLHELRTPVNAMQGYAEVIQQQVFGPTPHEYRALAASIAGDSARILAGFDELDRLAKLETGALELEQGTSDFAAIAREQIKQLQSVLSPRVARFEADLGDWDALLPLAKNEAEMLAWRVLATLAGATGAGETIELDLRSEGNQVALRAQLPAMLASAEDVFSSEARSGGSTVSSGIFGAGFSLRLARAEARAAGGELRRDSGWLVLSLPLLTPVDALPSPVDEPGRAAG
ncbi:sensor histidine kinase [Erythrobacter mangrovi]|uniref:histidine kinase n=1 Tax=Erythrobacter mangrovi TaxID=2739433 RepID=A0A7D4ATK0_9SPHN|nr:histidine kinase dimerization/phospho-acceptor domain-containing protein [Erythrobacter mangrovi]QKG71157.1 sensor histidine kinase [Erythrobacter mangrovi]